MLIGDLNVSFSATETFFYSIVLINLSMSAINLISRQLIIAK